MITRTDVSKKEYFNIHKWLIKTLGNAHTCQSPTCAGKSKRVEWALIKGKEHARDANNYMSLCSSCHIKYDYTKERRRKMSNSLKGKNLKFNKEQQSVIKKAYIYGCSLHELCAVFNCTAPAIIRFTKGLRAKGVVNRKFNERQVNVMRAAHSFGLSYSDISRAFIGSDKERAGIYRIITNQMYA